MSYYRHSITTVDDVIRQLEISTETDNNLATSIDTLISTKYSNSIARIKTLLFEVSDKLHQVTGYAFIPYTRTETRRLREIYAWSDIDYYRGTLALLLRWCDQPVLSVSSFIWDSVTQTSDNYYVGDESHFPCERLTLNDGASWSFGSGFSSNVSITGVWGYHPNPDRLWLDSGDSIQDAGGINATVTTVNVTSGANFETYQYIRIDDEWLFITSISSNALTVERGVLGTTATTHNNDTQIDTMQPYDVASAACRRLVVAEYLNPGELNRSISVQGQSVTISTGNDESNITMPRPRAIVRRL